MHFCQLFLLQYALFPANYFYFKPVFVIAGCYTLIVVYNRLSSVSDWKTLGP
jgi:hypothetical protein